MAKRATKKTATRKSTTRKTAAKKTARKKTTSAGSKEVESEMHRYKKGSAKSAPGGKGGKVQSRKQAIAIGLSKARTKGKAVPKNPND